MGLENCGEPKMWAYTTLSEDQRFWGYSMLLTTVVPTHLDLEYSYLVFGTLRWPIEVDPLHPDQRSEFKHTSAPYTHTHTQVCESDILLSSSFQEKGCDSEARLLKTQRQNLGFNLQVRKAKQPVTGSCLYFSPKWWSCLQESQNETETEGCLLPSYNPL